MDKNTFAKVQKTAMDMSIPICGYKVPVYDASHINPDQLGFATEKGVYINYQHPMLDNLPIDKQIVFIMGIIAHEFMHKVFSDFDVLKYGLLKYKDYTKKRLVQEIANIIEDPAIEYMAGFKIGGYMLKCLRFAVRVTYNANNNLEDASSAIEQLFNAYIMYGDMGIIKGKFTYPEAEQVFMETLPIMDKAIEDISAAGRFMAAEKVAAMIEHLIDDETFEDDLNSFEDSQSKTGRSQSPQGRGKAKEELSEDDIDSNDSPKKTNRNITKKKYQKRNDNTENRQEEDTDNGGSGKSNKKDDYNKSNKEKSESGSKSEEKENSSESDESDGKGKDNNSSDSEDNTDNSSGSDADADENSESDKSEETKDSKSDKKDNGNTEENSSSENSEDDAETDNNSESSEDDDLDGKSDSKAKSQSDSDTFGRKEMSSEKSGRTATDDNVLEEGVTEYIDDCYEITDEDIAAIIDEVTASDDIISEMETDISDLNMITAELSEKKEYSMKVENKLMEIDGSVTKLQEIYNEILLEVEPYISSLTRGLRKIFREDIENKDYTTTGRVSMKRLSSGQRTSRMFEKIRRPKDKKNMKVCLLIDESGSMRGENKAVTAKKTAIILAEVFAKLDIPLAVMGYTTDLHKYNVNHHHYLHWDNTPYNRLKLLNISAYNCNYDSFAVNYATQMIKKIKSQYDILIIVSDGEPSYGTNSYEDLILAVKNAKKSLKNVVGIGLGSISRQNFENFYGKDFIHVSNISNLPVELTNTIKHMVKKW